MVVVVVDFVEVIQSQAALYIGTCVADKGCVAEQGFVLLHPGGGKQRGAVRGQNGVVGLERQTVLQAIGLPAIVDRALQTYLAFSDDIASSNG